VEVSQGKDVYVIQMTSLGNSIFARLWQTSASGMLLLDSVVAVISRCCSAYYWCRLLQPITELDE